MASEARKPELCNSCGSLRAYRFQLFRFGPIGLPGEVEAVSLCVRCARAERRREGRRGDPSPGLGRAEVMAELDRFFSASGALEICRRCHEQGTGCCPPSCRALGPSGCRGKNLFCAAFVCSALLNAITECDPETGRRLRWAKQYLGPTEFRVFELMTRVPAGERELERPLALPTGYPGPLGLDAGGAMASQLSALAGEVLEVRRQWSGAGEGRG